MSLKVKIIRKFISILCAMSISTSFVITSASAIDTTDAEAAFSMQYINSLPGPKEADFDKFSGAYERGEAKIDDKNYVDTLQDSRVYHVKCPWYVRYRINTTEYNNNKTKYHMEKDELGKEQKVYEQYSIFRHTIKEKEVYDQIKKQVEILKDKVKRKTPSKDMNNNDIAKKILSKEISKHHDMPEKMRLAKAIYRWVAKNIPYDNDSLAYGKDINTSLRKPQDPLYVFAKKTGVCAGKANLLNLMMRLAGIPSVVITSHTHAFNAVYLEDKAIDRQSWILLDPTWGAPESDKSLQTGVEANNDGVAKEKEKEKTNPMIQGNANMSLFFMKNNFAMDDEYAKKINDMIYIGYGIREKMNDMEIDKFNQELAEKLKKLNDKTSGENGFKLNNIKIIRDKDGELLIEYETNVTQDKAEEFYKNVQEKLIESKASKMLQTYYTKLAKDNFEGLDEGFAEQFNEINKSYSRATLKRSKEYYNEFEMFCKDLLDKHKEELTNNINLMNQNEKNKDSVTYKNSETSVNNIVKDMNQTIKSKIDELNKKYKDIVKIKSFDIKFSEYGLNIGNVSCPIEANMIFDLPLADVIKCIKKQSNWSDMKEFFLGFYDKTLAFKYANENIIDWRAHKIEEMVFGNLHDSHEKEKNSVFDRKIDGITYKMWGPEGNKTLEVIGNEQKPLENVKISPDMANLGMPLTIGKGIKSLILEDNDIVDLSEAEDLENVDADNSTRYVADEIALYEKDTTKPNNKGKLISIFKHEGKFGDGVNFRINTEKNKDEQIEVNEIRIRDWDNLHNNVKLPKFLTQFNVPIKLDYGVKSLILEDNDIVDLSEAEELQCVYINNSNKYMVENGVLYEKNEYGHKCNKVNVPREIKVIDKTDNEKLNKTKNEYQKIKEKYINKVIETVRWKKSENIDSEGDGIDSKKNKLTRLMTQLKQKFDVNQAEEFIKLAKETMDMEDKFKQEYEQKKAKKISSVEKIQAIWKGNIFRKKINAERVERERIEKENNIKNEYQKIKEKYIKKVIETVRWKKSENIDSEGDEIDRKKNKLTSLMTHLQKKFDVNQAEEFIRLAKETMDMEDKFKQEYEQKKAKKISSVEKIQAIWKGNIFRKKINVERERIEKENNMKNEYQKIKEEYENKRNEFINWKKSENIDSEGDEIDSKKNKLTSLMTQLEQKFDVNQAEEFIKLAKENMDMMDKFKFNHTLKEYRSKHLEFIKWKVSKKISDNDDTTKNSRGQSNNLAASLSKQFDINKAKEFIKLAKETIDMMDKFKQIYEDGEFAKRLQEEINNNNIAG